MKSFALFLLVFVALFGTGYLFLGTAWGERMVAEPWTDTNIRAARLFAVAMGFEVRIEDERTLATDNGGVQVNRGCDGLGALLLVVAAVLGFPAPWRARAAGVLLGAAGVFAINAFRIATLLWVSVHWPDRLQFVHIDVWQPLMMLLSFGLFLGWGRLIEDRSRGKPADASP